MMEWAEKSEGHQTYWDSSSGDHEYLYHISSQWWLRHLSLDQSGEPTDRYSAIPRATLKVCLKINTGIVGYEKASVKYRHPDILSQTWETASVCCLTEK